MAGMGAVEPHTLRQGHTLATFAAAGISATARTRHDVTDRQLVEAVRAGDDVAFERLYARHRARVAGLLRAMVRDPGRAEDLTQEVFLAAITHLRRNDAPIAFQPWVLEIARNAAIDA